MSSNVIRTLASKWKLPLLGAALLLTAACGNDISTSTKNAPNTINPVLQAKAVKEAKAKQAKGQRVWCVPFARTASGVELRGNGGTWWNSAKGIYERGDAPEIGSVMAFASSGQIPMGHVAVVSEVISDRKILIDHANWHRNQVSLKMPVIDVSEKGDWSKVRVEGSPGVLGSVYPVQGFIYAGSKSEVIAAPAEIAAELAAEAQVEAAAEQIILTSAN